VIIQSLSVENVRTHQKFRHTLSPNVTLITGQNGSGKTTLLEAIMVALGGKSFKGSDRELLRGGSDWWRIDIKLDEQERTVKFNPANPTKRKQFTIDDKTTARLPVGSLYPIVLFEPEDLRLLNGSPSRRRQFIDRFAAQINPGYSKIVHRYERALLQRNKLLKTGGPPSSLFAWNVSLSEYGSQIIDARVRLIEQLNLGLQSTYDTIALAKDSVSIHYSHTLIDNTQQKMLRELEQQYERDRILGATTVGPHRHDVLFSFNNSPATQVASRGEVRTVVLALKFLEVDIIQQLTGRPPIVLLDDVFSELDETRQTHLATKFKDHQIIMTSASANAALDQALVIRLG
jgi:DNA replication and repair protein RecF